MCMLTPVNSSGTNGSALEIRNVSYNGHLVFKRAHAPILNVKYVPGSQLRLLPRLGGRRGPLRGRRGRRSRLERVRAGSRSRSSRRGPSATSAPPAPTSAPVPRRRGRDAVRPDDSDHSDAGGLVPLPDEVGLPPGRAHRAALRLRGHRTRPRACRTPTATTTTGASTSTSTARTTTRSVRCRRRRIRRRAASRSRTSATCPTRCRSPRTSSTTRRPRAVTSWYPVPRTWSFRPTASRSATPGCSSSRRPPATCPARSTTARACAGCPLSSTFLGV